MNFVPTVDPSTFESTLLKNTYVHAALGAMMIGNPSFWVKSFSIAPPEEEPEDLEMGDWIPSQPEAVSLDLVRLFGSIALSWAILCYYIAETKVVRIRQNVAWSMVACHIVMLLVGIVQTIVYPRWNIMLLVVMGGGAAANILYWLGFYRAIKPKTEPRVDPDYWFEASYVMYQALYGLFALGSLVIPELFLGACAKLEVGTYSRYPADILRQAGTLATLITFVCGQLAEGQNLAAAKSLTYSSLIGTVVHVTVLVWIYYFAHHLWNGKLLFYTFAWIVFAGFAFYMKDNIKAYKAAKKAPKKKYN